MDAEQVAQVFERFYRADPSRARSSGGAGLGLAIVAAVVEAHGGEVDAESVPGGGHALPGPAARSLELKVSPGAHPRLVRLGRP